MSRSAPLVPGGAEPSNPDGAAELLKSNVALREEIRQLRQARDHAVQRLAEAQVNSQTDRQARRAALNLMEDAVSARAAAQRDNAERRRVEEELRTADRRKDEFLAMLAHELRNPLAPIRNTVQILLTGQAGARATDEAYAMLDRQVNHLVRLVNDLMEASRITRGQIELHKERVDFSTVARNAIEIVRPAIEEARHQLDLRLPAEPLVVDGDIVRLTQVFANLLNNAAKYTPEGGRIALVAARDGADVVVTVSDNGIGISADTLPRVFDLFVRGERQIDHFPGGLGVGLTLVRCYVELHGGEISAKSQGAGQGSEFVVRLRLATPEATDHEANSSSASPPGAASHRILVVDDNQDSANSLALLLNHLGSDVSVVYDGNAALAALEAQRPEMILLDIGMPEMDGHEVARRVRQSLAGQNVVLVALTGWGQEEDRRRSRDAGFDRHLVKPIGLLDLQALLNSPLRDLPSNSP